MSCELCDHIGILFANGLIDADELDVLRRVEGCGSGWCAARAA
ncbi:MAG TPA: hypothetical protein VGF39_06120 [Stellaceae bacterium]